MIGRYLFAGAALIALVQSADAGPRKPARPATPPAAASPAALAAGATIPYTQFALKNGLRVIVHTDRTTPTVAVAVWYNVGSKMEPAGRTGFAHLFEHLMFNGSENAPGEFFAPLKDVGASDSNGTTNSDRTNYFETVPTPALERALFLESDRMGWLLGAMTRGTLDEQRGVVQNEKRQGDNQPFGLVQYRLIENLYPADHPYGHSVIGSMADLDRASLDDVKGWFRNHYGPNNAVLVLAGDIDIATARRLADKYFGGIPAGPRSVQPAAPVPTLAAPKREEMTDRVGNVRIIRAWAVPGLDDRESIDLDVAAGVLAGLSGSRLTNTLVRDEQLATYVTAGNYSSTQGGTFQITIDVKPGVDPASVERRVDALIADFLANGPTADEVRRYTGTAIASRLASMQSTVASAARRRRWASVRCS